ncbi:non-canonical purine NTP diphosphatase [Oscillatoria amoena NRMC-F 0135]|nr:non-canonical purine NTP diphosphatase [Oscillatoria amoena NRMC-F 0135]
MKEIVFATNNRHKIAEVQHLLENSVLLRTSEEIGCREELPETQETLEGNAMQKARYVYDRYSVVCFADDTGLEVDALNGEPGVYSARYAGAQKNSEDNINLLLSRLQGKSNRKAQFRCVIALVEPEGVKLFEGIVRGRILEEKRGAGGFGYDPVFLPDQAVKTLAELTLDEKNRISHRGDAVRKLVTYLREKYGQ